MAAPSPAPVPGNLTVPPLFGWEVVAAVVLLAAVLAVLAVVALSVAPEAGERAEWQRWLAARSDREPGGPPADG
jgi:putative exporter of polyketide antibiotics